MYGTRGDQGGVLAVNLDGTISSVDRYSTDKYLCGQLLFAQENLQNTRHTIRVTFAMNSTGLDNGYIDCKLDYYLIVNLSLTSFISFRAMVPVHSA